MNFEMNEYHRDISNEDMLTDIIRVADQLKKSSITTREYNQFGQYSCSKTKQKPYRDMSERKMPGIQWEILLDGKPVTQYCYFVNDVPVFCVGTEAIDGPNILLNRDYYIYFYAQYDEKSDSYLVITAFDGPFKKYPHGEKFIYGIDSFALL